MAKLDSALIEAITDVFRSNQLNSKKDMILHQLVAQQQKLQQTIADIEYKLKQEEEAAHDLKNEVVQVIRGTSAFGSVLLNQLIEKTKKNIQSITIELQQRNMELQNQAENIRAFEQNYEKLFEPIGMIETLSLSPQKVLIGQLIRKIYVSAGYQFEIEWSFQEFIECH